MNQGEAWEMHGPRGARRWHFSTNIWAWFDCDQYDDYAFPPIFEHELIVINMMIILFMIVINLNIWAWFDCNQLEYMMIVLVIVINLMMIGKGGTPFFWWRWLWQWHKRRWLIIWIICRFSVSSEREAPPPLRGTSEDLHAWSIYRQNLNRWF